MGIRQALATVSAVAVAAALAGCSEPEPPVQSLRADGIERVAAPSDAPVGAAVDGLQAFTEHFAEATAKKRENSVFSPMGLASAFAMLRAGADGETGKQLDSAFGFPEPGVHPAYNALTGDIATKGGGGPTVAIANGLFADDTLNVDEEFLHTLAENYGAGAQRVDFSDGRGAEPVNAWVNEQTRGRIPKVFEQLADDTKFVLANAVYLNAKWATPFAPTSTSQEGDFHPTAGQTVQVPMMRQENDMRYATGDGWHAAALPYVGDELAMWVIVPTAEDAGQPRITAEMLKASDSGKQRKVRLSMPRWDFGTDFELIEDLKRLGVVMPADVRKIAPNAMVTAAVHRANITVGEKGTEAAAATAIGGTTTSEPPQEERPVEVTADRPFAFAITHLQTGAPLFAGSVFDPTQQ